MDINKYITLKDKERHRKLSTDEQQALDQWSQSAEGKLLQQLDQLIDPYKKEYEPDVEAGLLRLKARMQEARQTENPIQLKVVARRRWMAVAAAVLVLAVAMVALRGVFSSQSKTVTLATAASEDRQMTLTDGTVVQLNANSTLTVPASFDNKAKRIVELSGEAYFDVAANPAQPFEIKAAAVRVTVVGTAFNVRAYANEATIEVEVEEGIVEMAVGEARITLQPQEKGIYNSGESKLYKKKAPQLNAQAWRTHRLQFQNAPLEEIIEALARYHRVQIDLDNESLKNCSYTCNFRKTKLEDALQSLRLSLNLQWEHPSPDHYIIRSGACQ